MQCVQSTWITNTP